MKIIDNLFAYIICLGIGFIVIDKIAEEIIKKEYKKTGKIRYGFWLTKPIFCLKLKWVSYWP